MHVREGLSWKCVWRWDLAQVLLLWFQFLLYIYKRFHMDLQALQEEQTVDQVRVSDRVQKSCDSTLHLDIYIPKDEFSVGLLRKGR